MDLSFSSLLFLVAIPAWSVEKFLSLGSFPAHFRLWRIYEVLQAYLCGTQPFLKWLDPGSSNSDSWWMEEMEGKKYWFMKYLFQKVYFFLYYNWVPPSGKKQNKMAPCPHTFPVLTPTLYTIHHCKPSYFEAMKPL